MTTQMDGFEIPDFAPDMHAHVCDLQDPVRAKAETLYRRQQSILTYFSTGTPDEWNFMSRIVDPAHLTFGIHPWYTDRWAPSEWMEIFRKCRFVGEIGMDTLWCNVPLEIQKKAFEYQLAAAADLKKPIVLHTKNCEEPIAEMVREFPGKILVHWYSGDIRTLFRFIDLDCYFTLGPDTSFMEQSILIKHVPLERLLTETDGISAVRWACENIGNNEISSAGKNGINAEIDWTDGKLLSETRDDFTLIPAVLSASAKCLARAKRLSYMKTVAQLYMNSARFAK